MTPPPDPEEPYEPPSLKLLRRLVTVLMLVMIAGIALITTLIALRYSQTRTPLPEVITLPGGSTATAFTQGPDWYAVVTADNEILIFDRDTGRLRQTLQIRTDP